MWSAIEEGSEAGEDEDEDEEGQELPIPLFGDGYSPSYFRSSPLSTIYNLR